MPAGLSRTSLRFVGGQKTRINELPQQDFPFGTVGQCREELFAREYGARSLSRRQVAEDLAQNSLSFRTHAVECRLCMLGEGSLYAADLVVGRAGQEPAFPVAPLPESRDGKRQERERPPHALDRREYFLHQLLVLKAVALFLRRFDDSSPQPIAPESS